jgi:hypothetical protein
VPHIYAAGDVIGFPSLASTSMEQGRVAACHAFGLAPPPPPEFFPYGIYSVPELHFAYDDSIESGLRLSRLIDEAVAADRKPEP